MLKSGRGLRLLLRRPRRRRRQRPRLEARQPTLLEEVTTTNTVRRPYPFPPSQWLGSFLYLIG